MDGRYYRGMDGWKAVTRTAGQQREKEVKFNRKALERMGRGSKGNVNERTKNTGEPWNEDREGVGTSTGWNGEEKAESVVAARKSRIDRVGADELDGQNHQDLGEEK